MNRRDSISKISFHGGHSGQFCSHAEGMLEDIVKAYMAAGYSLVGITEHMPPLDDRFLYSDERVAGLDAKALQERFGLYMETSRALQQEYRDHIGIRVGFETEWYCGAGEYIKKLVKDHAPDYIVGSLHHVSDMPIDTTPEDYAKAAGALGGLDALYERYFDEQLQLVETVRPAIVGHFDLVRIFDPDYRQRLQSRILARKIARNLRVIKEMGLSLDFNLAVFDKPGVEPYPTLSVLEQALGMGIPVVPGDDSHSPGTVGRYWGRGLEMLRARGASFDWEASLKHIGADNR